MFDEDKSQPQKEPECHAVQYPVAPKRIILHLENIDNPVISDAFVEAFFNALNRTDYITEMGNGEINRQCRLINTVTTKMVARQLESITKGV